MKCSDGRGYLGILYNERHVDLGRALGDGALAHARVGECREYPAYGFRVTLELVASGAVSSPGHIGLNITGYGTLPP